MPGGHTSLVNHFADHFAPTNYILIAGHLERPNSALTVTLNTMVLEDARDLVAVADLRLIVCLAHAANVAADRLRGGFAHGLARQKLIDRLLQVISLRRGALIADTVRKSILVVNAASIAHHAIPIKR